MQQASLSYPYNLAVNLTRVSLKNYAGEQNAPPHILHTVSIQKNLAIFPAPFGL